MRGTWSRTFCRIQLDFLIFSTYGQIRVCLPVERSQQGRHAKFGREIVYPSIHL